MIQLDPLCERLIVFAGATAGSTGGGIKTDAEAAAAKVCCFPAGQCVPQCTDFREP